jgi:ADP-ribosylglycohydrolase
VDTLAAIKGSIAEAFYGDILEEIASEVKRRTPTGLWDVEGKFNQMISTQTIEWLLPLRK